jgi:hypothetical protein
MDSQLKVRFLELPFGRLGALADGVEPLAKLRDFCSEAIEVALLGRRSGREREQQNDGDGRAAVQASPRAAKSCSAIFAACCWASFFDDPSPRAESDPTRTSTMKILW